MPLRSTNHNRFLRIVFTLPVLAGNKIIFFDNKLKIFNGKTLSIEMYSLLIINQMWKSID